MSFDNRIFNVNGNNDEQLLAALKLVFDQSRMKCVGWLFSESKGLVLLWSCSGEKTSTLPSALTAEECLPFVLAWLKGKDAEGMKCEGWDANTVHDGSNTRGWRVYCEDWGHVARISSAICAVRPAYMWHGK
jgi:hypothetical protein